MNTPRADDWRSRGGYFTWRPAEGDASAVEIFHVEIGDPGAPVLLLIHGWPTSSIDWFDVADQLSARFRICALDFPGYGFSDKPQGWGYSLTRDEDLIEFYVSEVIGADAGVVVAHDRGDSVALPCRPLRGRPVGDATGASGPVERQHLPAVVGPDPSAATDTRRKVVVPDRGRGDSLGSGRRHGHHHVHPAAQGWSTRSNPLTTKAPAPSSRNWALPCWSTAPVNGCRPRQTCSVRTPPPARTEDRTPQGTPAGGRSLQHSGALVPWMSPLRTGCRLPAARRRWWPPRWSAHRALLSTAGTVAPIGCPGSGCEGDCGSDQHRDGGGERKPIA
jgi:hypothetical protein